MLRCENSHAGRSGSFVPPGWKKYIDDIICLLVFEWYIALPMGWLYATVINRTCKKHNWWGAKDVPFTPCDGQIGLKGMALGNHRMCGPQGCVANWYWPLRFVWRICSKRKGLFLLGCALWWADEQLMTIVSSKWPANEQWSSFNSKIALGQESNSNQRRNFHKLTMQTQWNVEDLCLVVWKIWVGQAIRDDSRDDIFRAGKKRLPRQGWWAVFW